MKNGQDRTTIISVFRRGHFCPFVWIEPCFPVRRRRIQEWSKFTCAGWLVHAIEPNDDGGDAMLMTRANNEGGSTKESGLSMHSGR